MKHLMMTIYDSKINSYLPPFYCQTQGHAERMFSESSNNPDHAFFKHSSDFTMFQIGIYDDSDCSIVSLETKLNLGLATEFKGTQT